MVHDQLQFECRAHILIHMLSAVKSAYDEIDNENENNCYIFHVYIGWIIMHKFIIDWCISTDIFALESLLYTCIWIMEYLSRNYNIMIKRVY